MNLHTFDMNLFVVFHTLMAERSVTRTGERLGRTQSAISNSLKRLRELFHDPLYVRTPHGLAPTPRALELHKSVAEIIRLSQDCLYQEADFSPETANVRFVIGAPDRLSLPVILPFLEDIRNTAPGISIDLRTTDRGHAIQLIEDQEIDVALGWFDQLPPTINRHYANTEAFTCLCRRDHPILNQSEPASIEMILSFPHLVVSSSGDRQAAFDAILKREGLTRRSAMSLTNFTMAPNLLQRSDMIGVFTKRTADYFASHFGLATYPVPMEMEAISHDLIWHRRFDTDPKHMWLRQKMLAACS
ncbi:LysR family transcriptional regulator [Breoghania sp. L-A4]|uniref:LysR family transcriptional regulator n=1 Tax=Breoghania sp. L-A4 TaxID=2304600 RepID=UPI000E35EF68|nr:LysR family transcriptional regulator [Breoghania sp. L-A4]AXS41552.1 LysR family transcriptional regulator [Breoghania sp. L-A4]